ncbi:M48 family metallopeptidase [Streptacidiphilus griseoplanus]|uniref:M48 family metallopeptidase n=1 Tax=Peterkaempfera griseoplana TaxID=66896 RepID=UPI0007C82684|nr:M48 family metallopeptidase [Peterkaempfera griseoplana]
MTPSAVAAPGAPCPTCSAPLADDRRFVVWCPACEWNVDPLAESAADTVPQGRTGRRTARRRSAERAVAEQMYTEAVKAAEAASLRPVRGRAWFAAMGIAALVHLSTVVVTGVSLWWLVTGSMFLRVLGVPGLALAALLRPRLGRVRRRDEWSLTRAEAPALYGLADRVASASGAPPVHLIRATGEFNASYGRVGLRRRRVLTLGLPLWEILAPQERIALLAHEFGHAVNGDSRRGLWLGSAVRALVEWYRLTRPDGGATAGPGLVMLIAGWVANAVMLVVHKSVEAVLLILHRCTLRTGQRAEYLADLLAVRVASASATRTLLESMLLGESVEAFFHRKRLAPQAGRTAGEASRRARDAEFWQELRAYLDSVPEAERLRRLRVSALRMGSVDSTHPPTHLRVALVETRGAHEAAVVADEAETAALEVELAGRRAAVVASQTEFR